MIKTIKSLFLIRKTYQANSFIYYLKRLPLIGNIFPYSLYSTKGLKDAFSVISVIYLISKMFLGKTIYVLLVALATGFMLNFNIITIDNSQVFLNVMLFLTIAGGIAKCYVLEPNKDINYAITFLRMDAKQVVTHSYFCFLLSNIIGFLPIYLLFPLLREIGFVSACSLFALMISSKIIGGAAKLKIRSKKANYNLNNESFKELFLCALVACVGVVISFFNIAVNSFTVLFLAVIFGLMAVIAINYLHKYNNYNKIYKTLFLNWETVSNKTNSNKVVRDAFSKQILDDGNINYNKKGYTFLNDCFIKRHRKLLFGSTKKFVIAQGLILIVAVLAILFVPNAAQVANSAATSLLPFLTYLMCFTNCAERISKVLFMNCDNEMLTYRMYRQPKAILSMFRLRLKAILFMDWFQSLPLALGLPLVLFISGGAQNTLDYLILFISVMAMSAFFSVHNLAVYYVLQPYNKEVEMKNPLYGIVKGITYVGCYALMQINLPFEFFGIAIIIFSIVYVLLFAPLAYLIAPKTFKLK